ncbi:MAG: hypothetical protein P8099_05290 [Gemmatimonadota bacterium]
MSAIDDVFILAGIVVLVATVPVFFLRSHHANKENRPALTD